MNSLLSMLAISLLAFVGQAEEPVPAHGGLLGYFFIVFLSIMTLVSISRLVDAARWGYVGAGARATLMLVTVLVPLVMVVMGLAGIIEDEAWIMVVPPLGMVAWFFCLALVGLEMKRSVAADPRRAELDDSEGAEVEKQAESRDSDLGKSGHVQ